MFHLDHDADTPPQSDGALRDALLGTLRNELTLDPHRSQVKIDGADLRVDLTGARMATAVPPKKPAPVGERRAGPTFRHLRVHADPMGLDDASVRLDLDAKGVQCFYDRDADDGRWLLMLDDVEDGKVEVAIPQADLKRLIRDKVREGAKPHGVQVDDVQLTLAKLGERSLKLTANVTGSKKLPIGSKSFAADVLGELHVDDDLNARLKNLRLEGQGLVMKTLTSLLGGKLRELEARTIPLAALPLGKARLRDVRLDVDQDVHVHASFGNVG